MVSFTLKGIDVSLSQSFDHDPSGTSDRSEPPFAERVLESAPVIVLQLDAQGRIQYVNPHFEKLTGWSFAEIEGKDWFATMVVPQERQATENVFHQAISGTQTRGNITSIFTRAGQARQIEWWDEKLTGAQGLHDRLLAVGTDVTERYRATVELARVRDRLQEAQRVAGMGNWELDLRTDTLDWSDEIFQIFEIDPQQFDASFEEFLARVHPEDRQQVKEVYHDSVEQKNNYEISHRLLLPDGRVKHVLEFGKTLYDAQGSPVRSVGVVQDITERMLADQQRREVGDRMRMILRNITDGFIMLDSDWHCVETNSAGAAMFGRSQERMLGCCFREEFPEATGTDLEKTLRRVMEDQKPETSEIFYALLEKWFRMSIYPASNGIAVFFTDISETVRADAENQTLRDKLAHANRLGTLGEIASGLAHELNQPLTAIQIDASTARMLSEHQGNPLLDNCLQRLIDQSYRAGEIIRRMRSFIRNDEAIQVSHNLNLLIHEVLGMLGERLRHSGIRITVQLAPALPSIKADGIQIQQVISNLLRNAEDAMLENGSIPRSIAIHTEKKDDQVRLRIVDTGSGLDPAIADDPFVPFQSTKSSGIGLGLAICHTILTVHGGSIQGRSNPDRGATFTVSFPCPAES